MNIFAVCYTSIAENKKKYLVNNGARIFLNSHTHFNHIFVDLNLLWNIFGHFLTLLFLFRYNVAKILTRWKTSKKFFLVFSVQQFIVDLEKISLAVVTFLFVQKVCRLRKKKHIGNITFTKSYFNDANGFNKIYFLILKPLDHFCTKGIV